MLPRSTLSAIVMVTIVALSLACAGGLSRVGPEQIPRLEAQLSERPDDVELRVRLGVAYYAADRFRDAAETLQPAADAADGSGAAHLHLGLAREGLEDWSGAREAYAAYLETDPGGSLADDIRDRLAYLAHRRAVAEARAALEREDELSAEPPAPRSLAVLPYRPLVDDPELEPLGVALADMMITDFALAGGVTVLERSRIQALLDEMALAEAGYTEAGTGARVGRLLRAEHVIQGAVAGAGGERLRIETDVRNTERRETAARVSGEESVAELFDLEKRTVFDVLEALGVELTPAEREAIQENRTETLLAFLAYGEGLRALDRGDWSVARERFERAADLDPGFALARDRAEEAGRLERGSATSAAGIARRARREIFGDAAELGGVPPGAPSTDMLTGTATHTNPSRGGDLLGRGIPGSGFDEQSDERDPLQEALGTDDLTGSPIGVVDLVIRRPGGEEER